MTMVAVLSWVAAGIGWSSADPRPATAPTPPPTNESASPPTTASAAPAGEPVEFGAWTGVRYRIVIDPDWLAADEGHVYVQAAEQVYVIDPDTGAIAMTVANASDLCQGIGAGLVESGPARGLT